MLSCTCKPQSSLQVSYFLQDEVHARAATCAVGTEVLARRRAGAADSSCSGHIRVV